MILKRCKERNGMCPAKFQDLRNIAIKWTHYPSKIVENVKSLYLKKSTNLLLFHMSKFVFVILLTLIFLFAFTYFHEWVVRFPVYSDIGSTIGAAQVLHDANFTLFGLAPPVITHHNARSNPFALRNDQSSQPLEAQFFVPGLNFRA